MTLRFEIAGLVALVAAVPAAADGPLDLPAQPAGYAYQIEGRRDPFLKSWFPDGFGRPECSAPGLAGVRIGEVALRGIVLTRDGPIAMLVGPDGAAHFGRIGDRMCDGTITAIPPDRIVYARKPDRAGAEPVARVEVRLWPAGTGDERR